MPHARATSNQHIMSKVKNAGLAAIKRICADGRQHGWGQADSLAVIGAMLPVMPAKPKAPGEPGEMGAYAAELDGFMAVAERVINPSACRQWLESEAVGLLKPEPKTSKTRSKAAGLADALKTL